MNRDWTDSWGRRHLPAPPRDGRSWWLRLGFLLAVFLVTAPWLPLAAQPRAAWVRSYSNGIGGDFRDIYQTNAGNFALTGIYTVVVDSNENAIHFGSDCWWLLITSEGEVIAEQHYGERRSSEIGESLIELDNGDFAIAGAGDRDGMVIRVDERGNEIWLRNYGGDESDKFKAIIELKEGSLLACGWTSSIGNGRSDGYLVKLDGEGEVIWERAYGGARDDSFSAMREVEGGVVLAGYSDRAGWLAKVDLDGELLWSRDHRPMNGNDTLSGRFITLATCRDGGLFAAGVAFTHPGSEHWAFRSTLDGDHTWSSLYGLNDDPEHTASTWSAVQLPDAGFALVGRESANGGNDGTGASLLRIDRGGGFQWHQIVPIDSWNQDAPYFAGELYSVIVLREGALIACGSGRLNDGRRVGGGLVIRYVPEISAPVIVSKQPEVDELTVLRGDSVLFSVYATDAQGDSLIYHWTLEADTVSADTFAAITFPDSGDFRVQCLVSDGALADSALWTVYVREMFIASFTPDTLQLALRRGISVDFSVSVAAVEGDPVNYQWTLDNPDNPQPEIISDDSLATIEFLRSGNYALEAFAGRGESFDAVTWTISVRSAIWSFWPDELSLTVPPDTVINFGVNPFNPESDSLSYAWYFGEDLLGMDSTIDVQFGGEGRVEVTAIVADGAEVDTLIWNILVQPPDAVESNFLFPLSSFALSASPNPFNANTTVSYGLPAAAEIRLTLHDIGGRRVRVLADGLRLAGRHSALLDGSGLPAGVYLIRLEAGSNVRMMKAVVVK